MEPIGGAVQVPISPSALLGIKYEVCTFVNVCIICNLYYRRTTGHGSQGGRRHKRSLIPPMGFMPEAINEPQEVSTVVMAPEVKYM